MRAGGWLALGLAACTTTGTSPPTPPSVVEVGAKSAAPPPTFTAEAPAPEAVAPVDAGPRAACDTSSVPPALAEMPCVPDDPYVRMRAFGFSQDGSLFGHCSSSCEVCGMRCTFTELATGKKKVLRFSDEHRGADDATLQADARRDAPLSAFLDHHYPESTRIGEGKIPRTWSGPFPYADVVFSSKSSYDATTGRATLAFGGRVGDGPNVYPFSTSFGPHEMWKYQPDVVPTLKGAERTKALAEVRAEMRSTFTIEPPLVATIDVSKDGKHLGVVVMTNGTRFAEYSDMWLFEPAKLVGRIANESGFVLHKEGAFARAAVLFGRAASTVPSEPLYAYNEACALARAGDAKVEEALSRAVRLGGAATKARARKDEDLASVRSAPWFTKLVGP